MQAFHTYLTNNYYYHNNKDDCKDKSLVNVDNHVNVNSSVRSTLTSNIRSMAWFVLLQHSQC